MLVKISNLRESLPGIFGLLPAISVILLLTLLAYTASQLIWLVLTPATESPLMELPVSSAGEIQAADRPDYAAQIASRHLFGVAEVQKTDDQPIDAPETQLNLKLRGLYATTNEAEGYALIASGSSEEKLYAINDRLPGNTKLKAVYPDRVILERAGRLETLNLLETKTTGGKFTAPTRSSPRSSPTRRKFGPNSQVGKLRREILKNPAKLAELVNAVPASENGQFIGFRIITKKPHAVFKDLYLRSGDIITQVNGIAISSPEKGLQVLQQLSTAQQVQVTLKRNGQTIHLNHSL